MREDGIRYEQFCCEYLEQRGYSTKTTQTTGDQGVDVIAVKDGIKYAIQCKYRVDGLVGNDAVQQVVSGKEFYDCDIAVVMTNTTFTSKAKELADKIHVKIWDNIDFPKKEDGNIENTTLLDANVVKKEKIINAYISQSILKLFGIYGMFLFIVFLDCLFCIVKKLFLKMMCFQLLL